MSENGAFDQEMSREVDTFFAAVRTAVPVRPDPRIEQELISRLAQTARVAAPPPAAATPVGMRPSPAPRRSRFALPARIAIAAGLLVVSMTGLAIAGVKLPGPVNDALDSVGVTLPNQDEDDSTSVPAVPSGTGPGKPAGAPGKAKGKSKKNKAKKKRNNGKKDNPPGHQNNPADPQGQAIGHGGTPPGQAKVKPDRGSTGSAGATGTSNSGGRGGGRPVGKIAPVRPVKPSPAQPLQEKLLSEILAP